MSTASFSSFFLRFLPPLALMLAACGGVPVSTGTPPEQLESIAVKDASTTTEDSLTGTITITGSERDFSVRITNVALGEWTFDVHSPGMTDLTAIAPTGMTTATVSQVEAFDENARSLVLTDDAGPLYVADVGIGVDRDKLFGKGFVTWGEPVATEVTRLGTTGASDYQEKGYTPAVFATDNGPVSLLPGEVGTIQVHGAIYRAAVITAYTIEYQSGEGVACGDTSTLSYELFRVSAKPEAKKVTRPASLPPARLGCVGP